MDRQIEKNCSELLENYSILASCSRMEFPEMVLACAGIYYAAGVKPDVEKLEECGRILKSRAGLFSNFRGMDTLLVRCKMALAPDPDLYFDNLEKNYRSIKSLLSGEQTVLAAMILTEQETAGEDLAERTKQIYSQMKQAHRFLTTEEDLPFAALMAASGKDTAQLSAEADEIYALLKKELYAENNTVQMLSHILSLYGGRTEEKCEKLCALANGLKEAGHSLGRGSSLGILGILAEPGSSAEVLTEKICEADDYLKQYKPFHGLFGVGKECRRMFAVQMVHASDAVSRSASAMMAASVELAVITVIVMMAAVSSSAAAQHGGSK